jgi:hypothetical protein
MFLVSVADKGLRVGVSGLESTLARISVSVASEGVTRMENSETLPASAEEELPEWEGQMDQSADQRLDEVLAGMRMLWRPLGAAVRVVVVVEESEQSRAQATEAWLGIATRGWGQRNRDADRDPEMLGVDAMNSAPPLIAERIRRSWEAGEFVAKGRVGGLVGVGAMAKQTGAGVAGWVMRAVRGREWGRVRGWVGSGGCSWR